MDVVVVDKVVEEVNKVVEEVNKELVMGVVVEGVVDKEVTRWCGGGGQQEVGAGQGG